MVEGISEGDKGHSEVVDLAEVIVDPSRAPLLVNHPAERIIAHLMLEAGSND